jgi:hypothetical protein
MCVDVWFGYWNFLSYSSTGLSGGIDTSTAADRVWVPVVAGTLVKGLKYTRSSLFTFNLCIPCTKMFLSTNVFICFCSNCSFYLRKYRWSQNGSTRYSGGIDTNKDFSSFFRKFSFLRVGTSCSTQKYGCATQISMFLVLVFFLSVRVPAASRIVVKGAWVQLGQQ